MTMKKTQDLRPGDRICITAPIVATVTAIHKQDGRDGTRGNNRVAYDRAILLAVSGHIDSGDLVGIDTLEAEEGA